jgi:hypothetical protein
MQVKLLSLKTVLRCDTKSGNLSSANRYGNTMGDGFLEEFHKGGSG